MAQIVSVRDEQLDKIKKAMERKLPFLSSVMATVNLKWSKKTSTACEDDLTEYYNPDFMNALPFDQQVAVMAHETLHIALNHIWRSKNRDSALWNIATDAVINSILKENGLYMPQGAIDMPEALHKSSEEVYDMLVKDKKQRQGDKKQRQGAKGGSGNNNQQNKQQNKQQQGESDQSSAGNKEDQKGQQSGGNQQDQKSQNQPQENNQAQSSSGSQANYKGQEDPNGNSASGTGNFGDYKEPDNHDIWADALKRMEKRNKNKNKDDNNQKQGEEKDKDKDEQNKDKNNKNKGKGDKNKDKKDKGKDNFSQGDDQRKGEGDLNPDEDEQDQEDGQSQGERDDDFEDQLNKQKEEDYRQDSQDEYKKEGEEKVQHEDNNDYNQIERDFTKLNDQLKRELADQIRKDINQRSKDWGTKSGNQTGYMGSVGEGKAIVSWKKILKKELEKEERRWGYRRANRENFYSARIQNVQRYDMPITEVIMDTSGSVDDDLLRSFLRQLKRISKESKLKAGCFDTMFYGFTDIRKMSDIDNFRIYGRGGTDLDAALKGFSKDKKVNKIVFTDGYGPQMLKLDMKVIWVVYDNPEFVPLTGKKVIHVSKEMVYDNNSTTHDYDDDYDDEI